MPRWRGFFVCSFLSLLSASDSVEECRCLFELAVRLREVPVDGSYVESDNRCDLAPAPSLSDEQDDSLLGLRQLWNRHDIPLSIDQVSVFGPGNAEVTRW